MNCASKVLSYGALKKQLVYSRSIIHQLKRETAAQDKVIKQLKVLCDSSFEIAKRSYSSNCDRGHFACKTNHRKYSYVSNLSRYATKISGSIDASFAVSTDANPTIATNKTEDNTTRANTSIYNTIGSMNSKENVVSLKLLSKRIDLLQAKYGAPSCQKNVVMVASSDTVFLEEKNVLPSFENNNPPSKKQLCTPENSQDHFYRELAKIRPSRIPVANTYSKKTSNQANRRQQSSAVQSRPTVQSDPVDNFPMAKILEYYVQAHLMNDDTASVSSDPDISSATTDDVVDDTAASVLTDSDSPSASVDHTYDDAASVPTDCDLEDYDYDTVEAAETVADEDENHNSVEDDYDHDTVEVTDYAAEDDENHNTVDQLEEDNWWVHYPSEDEYSYEESDGAWDDEEETSCDD